MYKLGHLEHGNWVEHIWPAAFQLPEPGRAAQRLVAGVPGGNPEVFRELVESLEAPYFLLYVLHTPRGEGPPGRYQSPAISAAEFREFVADFSAYLSQDARFDIWAHSPAEKATVVWDRHNQIYAYGPLSRFARAFKELGFSEGAVGPLGPHQHNYHKEFDPFASQVLNTFDWSYSPLRQDDEQ